jgi:hypothetical protein
MRQGLKSLSRPPIGGLELQSNTQTTAGMRHFERAETYTRLFHGDLERWIDSKP